MQRLVHGLLIALAILPVGAHAQTDWIDAFPSVTEVAHAAFEELKVTRAMSRMDMTADDDSIAVNLAGTLNVLRQIMYLKFIAEQPMPKAREDKLKKLVATYLEAELTIGRGASTRRGYITRAPSAGGQGCAVQDQECYRRWFLAHLHANTSRAEYRERFLRRAFPCGTLAKELNDLRQSRAATMPYFPSPAVNLQTDGQLAGLAPVGCTAYGGDANRNGLCDDWEPATGSGQSASAAATAVAAASAPIELLSVRLADEKGLRIQITRASAKPGMTACFRVTRSPTEKLGVGAQSISSEIATITSEGDDKTPLVAYLARSQREQLVPDTQEAIEAHPYLVVEVLPMAGSPPARAPGYCEHPLKAWLERHRKPQPAGLHGPFDSARDALEAPGAIALMATTGEREHGFLILRDMRPGGLYYATPPRESEQTVFSLGQALFTHVDFFKSGAAGFARSCADPRLFALAATVHTHPVKFDAVPVAFDTQIPIALDFQRLIQDYFSWLDFEQAVLLWKTRHLVNPKDRYAGFEIAAFERIYMISARTGCIQEFEPQRGDDTFTTAEKVFLTGLNALPRIASDRYDAYWKRQVQVGCYRPKQ